MVYLFTVGKIKDSDDSFTASYAFKGVDTPLLLMAVQPPKAIGIVIFFRQSKMLQINMVQVHHEAMELPMYRKIQQVPVLLPLFIPLSQLPNLIPHKIQLFPRMGIHIHIENSGLREFLLILTVHFLQDCSFSVNDFIMGQRQKKMVMIVIHHGKGQLMIVHAAICGSRAAVIQGVVHPAHVPLIVKSKAVFRHRLCNVGIGCGVLRYQNCGWMQCLQPPIHILQEFYCVQIDTPSRVSLPINHAADCVHAQAIYMKFRQPVIRGRLQKAANLTTRVHEVYHRAIPNEAIDMDFMNLNQAAHGDREHGFLAARLRMPQKIIAGHWLDETVQARLGRWMKTAVGAAVSREMKVMRFGDNMREVAVTEGDKVEVQAKLGWQVNTWAVGDLVREMDAVSEAEMDALMAEYERQYTVATEKRDHIRCQAREEIAIRKMLDGEGCRAFTNTFQDLYGMEQLPGLASQHLMAQGYGFGGEGDWKVAAMTAILKAMGDAGNGASTFMEDYTYHLVPGEERSLGAHMLEVCPSIAAQRPRIETHPLHIGMNEKDPARLVFEGKAGDAIVVSLIDMGGRLRLICQDIHCIKPIMPMPNLPVARVMWQAEPSLTTGVECWLTAGGAHHTVLSYDVTAEQMRDWAAMMEIEFVHISKDTTPERLEHDLFLSDLAWKLK